MPAHAYRLKHESEARVVRAVLAHTRFESKHHDLDGTTPGEILKEMGLLPMAYCCISPAIKVWRADVPHAYAEITIDLRDHREGNDCCDHAYVRLYWETGGSMMDSGIPHEYHMCCKCGHHNKRPGLLARLINWILGRKPHEL